MVAIGLNFQPELREFIEARLGQLDYIEIVPDIGWQPGGPDHDELVDDPEVVGFLDAVVAQVPLVAHSIGLSIGSAHRMRTEHVDKIAEWDRRYDFLWHSDHVGFNFVLDAAGDEYTVGVPLPFPLTTEMLQLVAERASVVQQQIAKRFLLEHNSSYVRLPGDEFSEAGFLNLLCEQSGCGVLLDLHNIYVNARNGLDDIDAFLAELDFDNVVEIHLAGGLEHGGYYLDAHSGPVPTDVWTIAQNVLPQCKNVRGVTFELLGSWFQHMGNAGLDDTLARMRELST